PRQRFSTLAVQLVIPLQDRFLSADLYSEISEWVPNLTVCHVDGGHWLPLSHSTELTMLIAGFVNQRAP
ncbi:MAG: alpha/beta hydrolase, partial [Gammaproteobacteria bacterium]|nr:alpha/beta hydrolase [Gammaproteobacteria bacterium]MBU1833695.1 alpha/beta hydrolase [Gammaproteobacteria bacterium]